MAAFQKPIHCAAAGETQTGPTCGPCSGASPGAPTGTGCSRSPLVLTEPRGKGPERSRNTEGMAPCLPLSS